jgi:hypothetical protein
VAVQQVGDSVGYDECYALAFAALESKLPCGGSSLLRMPIPQWGDVPTWGLLVGAAFTVVFAGRAFNSQSKQLKDQQATNEKLAEVLPLQADELRESLDERAREKENQRRAQASKVAAWFEVREMFPGKSASALEWGARIRNGSDLPILDVTTAFHSVKDPGNGQPWTPEYAADMVRPIRVIPPAGERSIQFHDSLRSQEKISPHHYVVSIGFTDAAGYRWRRDPRGALKDGTSAGGTDVTSFRPGL